VSLQAARTDRVGTATEIRRAARLEPPGIPGHGGLYERPGTRVSGEHSLHRVVTTLPRAPGERPWWDDDYTVAHKIKDRELFS
jgi:hypothetical protein